MTTSRFVVVAAMLTMCACGGQTVSAAGSDAGTEGGIGIRRRWKRLEWLGQRRLREQLRHQLGQQLELERRRLLSPERVLLLPGRRRDDADVQRRRDARLRRGVHAPSGERLRVLDAGRVLHAGARRWSDVPRGAAHRRPGVLARRRDVPLPQRRRPDGLRLQRRRVAVLHRLQPEHGERTGRSRALRAAAPEHDVVQSVLGGVQLHRRGSVLGRRGDEPVHRLVQGRRAARRAVAGAVPRGQSRDDRRRRRARGPLQRVRDLILGAAAERSPADRPSRTPPGPPVLSQHRRRTR